MRYRDLVEAADAWTLIAIDDLPAATQDDICGEIAERNPAFADHQNPHDVRANLFGLAVPPKVWLGVLPVPGLHATMQRTPSESVVKQYLAMLRDPRFHFDPILVARGKFLDGGHRMEAYKRAGREVIPVVEVGHIVFASPETWEAWIDGDPQADFAPGPHP